MNTASHWIIFSKKGFDRLSLTGKRKRYKLEVKSKKEKEKGKRKKNLISLCDLLETHEEKNKLNDANPFTFLLLPIAHCPLPFAFVNKSAKICMNEK
ncbi:MAG: hypothetical protein ABS44_07430 [Chryseobacterium sp. SCN 40-13]|nr:MAG: hypothetical protein ABS44_07430 [Chryseobacterium sp. SCN 40-13]